MPKAPATQEEVEAVRGRILEEALSIINAEGYANLSMRKLALRLGFTAKTIYNYYSNKDELYLMALIEGFGDMVQDFRAACRACAEPVEKLRALAQAYVRWGIANKHSYNIMFSMDTPKYSDYIGTPMEPVAERQNLVALQLAEIATAVLSEAAAARHLPAGEIPHRLLQFWSTLHGLVSLSISRVTLEVGDVEAAMPWLIEELVRPYAKTPER